MFLLFIRNIYIMGRLKGSVNKVNKIQETIEAQVKTTDVEPQPLFSIQHTRLCQQIKPLFNFIPDSEENFEIKLRWFMIKCNLFYETINYYWMQRFYQEHSYMNIAYIKKELNLK